MLNDQLFDHVIEYLICKIFLPIWSIWTNGAVQFSLNNLITLIQLCLFCGRLSQDLAKDLAILAQEIHNVAGDGETPNTASVDEPASACTEVTFHFSVVFCIYLPFPETF